MHRGNSCISVIVMLYMCYVQYQQISQLLPGVTLNIPKNKIILNYINELSKHAIVKNMKKNRN